MGKTVATNASRRTAMTARPIATNLKLVKLYGKVVIRSWKSSAKFFKKYTNLTQK
jgi:hypothetical protein